MDFLDESERVGSKIDFSLILLRQFDRILKALSFGYEAEFIRGVKALEILLTPYTDNQHQAKFKQILGKYQAKEKKLRPDDSKSDIMMIFEYDKSMEIYGLLMGLAKRKAFIPTVHRKDEI